MSLKPVDCDSYHKKDAVAAWGKISAVSKTESGKVVECLSEACAALEQACKKLDPISSYQSLMSAKEIEAIKAKGCRVTECQQLCSVLVPVILDLVMGMAEPDHAHNAEFNKLLQAPPAWLSGLATFTGFRNAFEGPFRRAVVQTLQQRVNVEQIKFFIQTIGLHVNPTDSTAPLTLATFAVLAEKIAGQHGKGQAACLAIINAFPNMLREKLDVKDL